MHVCWNPIHEPGNSVAEHVHPRPGPEGTVNSLVHKACLELDITHIESLCNLEALLGKGQFTFIGLPMKWRGGTGSPIRAVAVFDIGA